MQVIDRQRVAELLTFNQLIQALRTGFAKPANMPKRNVYSLDESEDNHDAFAVLPSWNEEVLAVKAFSYFPQNPNKGKDSLYSKIMLFNREFGEPLALIDGTEVTLWRTACVSALAADILARTEASNLVFFGTGKLAPFMIKAHLSVRNYQRVTVIARSLGKAKRLVSSLRLEYPEVAFSIATKADKTIIESADVMSCATGSHEPLFDGNWLTEGTHIDLIGNHHKNARECDTQTVIKSRVFVDSRVNVLGEAGELLIPIDEGVFKGSDVIAELSEMVSHETMRQSERDITLFKSVGTALSDLIGAKLVYDLDKK
ncbi:ornithine cyclodeaminase family protein [Pseudoalteromonas sp. T1lg65]|uniref:ornithine cyclodeaminase family protein n=1 Tax=Pseudoalteromonas sp. T1lg65 TaxID=2077101 RepID=UPI003F797620